MDLSSLFTAENIRRVVSWRVARYVAGVLVIVLGFVLALTWITEAASLWIGGSLDPQHRLQLASGLRANVISLLGGGIVGFGLLLTAFRIQQAFESNRIAEEARITERYAQALIHLNSNQRTVCLGGIYELERIARDSNQKGADGKDWIPAYNVLAAFVREKTQGEDGQRENMAKPNPENLKVRDLAHPGFKVDSVVQAALTVLGRRVPATENQSQQNHVIDLSGCLLRSYRLEKANLDRADLTGADLTWANLKGASLRGSTLDGTILLHVSLQGGLFSSAKAHGTVFERAWLPGVVFRGESEPPFLEPTSFAGSVNFSDSDLRGADFVDVDARACMFSGAETKLDDIRMSGCQVVSLHLPPAPEGGRPDKRLFDGAIIDGVEYDSTEDMPDPRNATRWKDYVAELEENSSTASATSNPPRAPRRSGS